MSKRRIVVTQEDVDAAIEELKNPESLRTECCPVAQAVRRELNVPKDYVQVGPSIRVYKPGARRNIYDLTNIYIVNQPTPDNVSRFIYKFDMALEISTIPLEFEVDILSE